MEEFLGLWATDKILLENLKSDFISENPFNHVIIENFLDEKVAIELSKNFPNEKDERWTHYNNPIEKKMAMNKSLDSFFQNFFDTLVQNDKFVALISSLVGIPLLADEHLHGAGLHFMTQGSKLDMHLDYSIHPISGKERRVNLIIYLSEDWNENWGGALELWDSKYTKCEKKIFPKFNRAVLFRTSDLSYHGIPSPIKCPKEVSRKSIAAYYLSEPRDNASLRKRAEFFPLPWQTVSNELRTLYEIRKNRPIIESDLISMPDWISNGNGFW